MSLYFAKLCWKNVWRNRRRTLITVNAIAFGVMALVSIQNYYDAFHEQLVHNAIRFQGGHLMVTAPKYTERNSPSHFVSDPSAIYGWLDNHSEIAAHSSRVAIQGLLSSARGSANILFLGVNPEHEKRVTHFASNLTQGNFLAPGVGAGRGIVLGEELASVLEVKLGAKVVALTQGIDGSIGNELFQVRGIFKTQSEADKSLAFVDIEDARSLSSLPAAAIHQIAVILRSDEGLTKAKYDFSVTFPLTSLPAESRAEILSWMEVQPHVMAMIELDRAVNRLLMIVILFVAALGIANSILMCIMERTREFGVMMAIGTTRSEFVRMAIGETMCLAGVGIFLGNLLGVIVTSIFGQTGFDLAWLTSQKLMIHGAIIQTVSYPSVHWETSALVTGIVILLSLLVSIIPVRYIARLSAVQALRY